MNRRYPLFFALLGSMALRAATGGPDQYGYLWKDNAEPDGPTYSWIDITSTGEQVMGLADDNVVGPLVMTGSMPYYWYNVENVWIGSNGYVAFNPGNMAANFPFLPTAGATDDYMAVFMADLTFLGDGNPGQCYTYDDPEQLVISWINVPFWSVTAPGYAGSNTFQLILNKSDSTITMQYQSCTGVNTSNGPVMGIESITGDIGLARSQSLMPTAGYAVRYYNPAVPLLDINDAAVAWVGEEGSGGASMPVDGSMTMHARIQNTGNQVFSEGSVISAVLSPSGQTVVTETLPLPEMEPGTTYDPAFTETFTPTEPGTYKHQVTITGIDDEFSTSNNVFIREVTVYDPIATTNLVDWAGDLDDGIGIGWNGGDGGAAVYILPPSYPCQITGTTIRISSNVGTAFTMKIYDDDGLGGGPGTLLDSAYISGTDAGAGDHIYPLSEPIQVTDGGYYVEWYMQGPSVNIALDNVAPFSLRCYEVLGGVWANYRDRATQDFHLGLEIALAPFVDMGCAGIIGIDNGQTISAATPVSALIQNYGNIDASNIPVHYQFNGGPVVTQTYTGVALQPGTSALVNFTEPLQPAITASGELCVWTSATDDAHSNNDTSCVSIDVLAGIGELHATALTLMPNPARDRVAVTGIPPGRSIWEVVDASGRRVRSGNMSATRGQWLLDTSGLANGPYLLQATNGKEALVGRFIVQH
jgi:hypothetical protein